MIRLALAVAVVGALSVGCQQSASNTSSTSATTGGDASGTSAAPQAQATPSASATAATGGATRTTADGLQIEEVLVGTGATAETGKAVSVHYTGRLADGTKFDSSVDRGQPLDFTLGTGRVIKGWEEGIVGMKVGGKRKLTIPPALGYGEQGYPGAIPPNSTLVFDIELMGVK